MSLSHVLSQHSVTRTPSIIFFPRPPRTNSTCVRRAHASMFAGSCIRPANAGTRNPRGFTRPAQGSSLQ